MLIYANLVASSNFLYMGKDVIQRDKNSLVMSFILLNYDHILNDLDNGGGSYVSSLASELHLNPTTAISYFLKKAHCVTGAYQFAIAVLQ